MHVLDSADARQRVIDVIESGEGLTEAARAIGVKNRKTITRWRDRDTEESRAFKLDLETARIRRTQLQTQTKPPRLAPDQPSPMEKAGIERVFAPLPAPALPALEPPNPDLWTREEYLAAAQSVADDDEHPACATAWRILGGWHLDAPMAAKRLIAERETADAGQGDRVQRIVMELPEPGVPDDGVIDAEVIEP